MSLKPIIHTNKMRKLDGHKLMARYSDTRGRPRSSYTFACTQTNTHTPAMSLAICQVGRSIISAINISCLFQTIRIAVIIPLPWDTTVTHFARQHNMRPHTLQRVTLPNRSLTHKHTRHVCDTLQIHSHINAPLSKNNIREHMHSIHYGMRTDNSSTLHIQSEWKKPCEYIWPTQSSLGHINIAIVYEKNILVMHIIIMFILNNTTFKSTYST